MNASKFLTRSSVDMISNATRRTSRLVLPVRRLGSVSVTTEKPQPRLEHLRRTLAKEEGSAVQGGLKSDPSLDSSSSLATTPAISRGTFAIETYGCQMNVSDSEIVRSILLTDGWSEVPPLPKDMALVRRMDQAGTPIEAPDLTLINTCAIRDNAENKIWERLNALNGARKGSLLGESRRTNLTAGASSSSLSRRSEVKPASAATAGEVKQPKVALVGVLGCMAERLKERLLSDAPGGVVDLVVRAESPLTK